MISVSIKSSIQNLLERNSGPDIAVAVSGGPDSMALLAMLTKLGLKTNLNVLTVDHQLRPEARAEAETVGAWIKDWPHVRHHILTWTHAKPVSGIMEAAREARYALMADWTQRNAVTQLWLGHNRTDQAETFLFRLCKGSGLDGLSGMQDVQKYRNTDLALVRPLLDRTKEDLSAYCREENIPHFQDPTNSNLKYARSRLRQSLPALDAEGLSEKRLSVTAARLARAREALDYYAAEALDGALTIAPGRGEINLSALAQAPMEIRIRMIRHVLMLLEPGYGPRLESLETCVETFFSQTPPAKRFTLGGFVFTPDYRLNSLIIEREKPY